MKTVFKLFVLIMVFFLVGCEGKSQSERKVDTSKPVTQPSAETEDTKVEEGTFNVIINNITYTAHLDQSETAQAFTQLLPLTMEMTELNGNEKYFKLSESLPGENEVTGEISAGDIMLYNNDTLVLFYENFTTDYHYSRIGRIDDPAGLADNLGPDNVQVTMN